MLNACGVVTPTNPLPPTIFAPRGASPAETLRQVGSGVGCVCVHLREGSWAQACVCVS